MSNHLTFSIACNSMNALLDRWSSVYRDGGRDAEHYDPFIGVDLRGNWTALRSLFVWRNGQELSAAKEASVRHHYFDRWIEDADLEGRLLNPVHPGGAIWNIFYMHIRQPGRWPLYDQHTHRAMLFIKSGEVLDDVLRGGPQAVYESYRDDYIPFVDALDANRRRIDRALSTFGQFLKLASPYCPSAMGGRQAE
jgi:hypothetical protein